MSSVFSSKAGKLASMESLTAAQNAQAGAAKAINTGEFQGLNAIYGSLGDRLKALGTGYDTARNDLTRARSNYDFYIPGAQASWNQLLDAGGVNGAAGHDAAVANFRASPGYAKDVEMTNDAVNRGAAAGGQLLSGNTLNELNNRQHDLADKEWGNYYDRLQGISDRGQSAVAAQAGIDANMGNLAYGYGGQVAGQYGDVANTAAGIYTNSANSLANSLTNLGNQQINAYGQASEADQNAGRNRLNLGMGLANIAGNVAGAYFNPTGTTAKAAAVKVGG